MLGIAGAGAQDVIVNRQVLLRSLPMKIPHPARERVGL